jgi:hypothetical protein
MLAPNTGVPRLNKAIGYSCALDYPSQTPKSRSKSC